ncbi:MAG: putative transporter [Candidatus Aminicenantes bacterium]|nr:putative transporter [Candidatus Aminicenantes bacterium]
MTWIRTIFEADSAAHALLVLSLIIAFGTAAGRIRVFKVSLGLAGVLFAGLIFGHLGITTDQVALEFARDLGLVLFVYTIGQEVGPGFLASFRRHGLRLNLLATAVVLLGGLVTVLVFRWGGVPLAAAAGIFSGATTNTPSLAAAQQALQSVPGYAAAVGGQAGMGYAMAYPFGVLGLILGMVAFRSLFRIDIAREAMALEAEREKESPPLSPLNIEVQNPRLDGLPLVKVFALAESRVVVSRLFRQLGGQEVPRGATVVRVGDVITAVGSPLELEKFKLAVGREAGVDLTRLPSDLTVRRLMVTRGKALGKSVQELDLLSAYDVVATRVVRTGLEFTPKPTFRLQYGDVLVVVGKPSDITFLAADLGDSPQRLREPHIIPIFLGISLGVILGSLPIRVPWLPAPVRIGLAGGPLIVAIVLSRVHHLGPLVWYMPMSANLMLRHVGISLFLACVGLTSGRTFVESLLHGGVYWIFCGMAVTAVPIIVVTLVARFAYRLNFLTLCGMLSGSMTDPPALTFAQSLAPRSEGASIGYVTVYPLTIILRVFVAQALVMLFAR